LILIDLGNVIKSDTGAVTRVTEQHSEKVEKDDAGKNKAAVKSAGAKKKKVLIVDDSTMMRGTLKSYIAVAEYDVIEAGDGEEAVAKVKEEEPDVVFLDIKMPKLNGIEALRKIKEMRPKTVVVMETSVYEDETKNRCLELGAKDYLKKPINKKQIEEILKMI